MLAIGAPLLWFVFVTAIVVRMQTTQRLTYDNAGYAYLVLYVLASGGVLLSAPLSVSMYLANPLGILIGLSALIAFFRLELRRSLRFPPRAYYGYTTLPTTYWHLLQPRAPSLTAKAPEIVFQDVVALTLILGLLSHFTLATTTAIFIGIVALAHAGGVWAFGYVYGTMFLVYSTVLAGVLPWLVVTTPLAFYLVLSLHLLMYPIMLWGMRWLAKRWVPVKNTNPRSR